MVQCLISKGQTEEDGLVSSVYYFDKQDAFSQRDSLRSGASFVDLWIIKALVWRCVCLLFSLDIPSNFSPFTKLPAAFCAEWNLRFRSKDLI